MTASEFPKRIEKPWGFELLFAHTPKYAGKIIFVRKGHRLSLQYHETKDETLYIQSGRAEVEMEKAGRMEAAMLEAGCCWRVPPHTKHRIKAVEDTTLFEVSTPELDDVKRLQDDYGRIKP